MRDLLSKVVTGSMIAGAALLVAACGGSEDATANNANMVEEPLMNDTTTVDAMNGTDANLGAMDSNTTDTTTTTNTTDTTTTTNTTTTNGM